MAVTLEIADATLGGLAFGVGMTTYSHKVPLTIALHVYFNERIASISNSNVSFRAGWFIPRNGARVRSCFRGWKFGSCAPR